MLIIHQLRISYTYNKFVLIEDHFIVLYLNKAERADDVHVNGQ